jgi:hypothetical protein
LRKLIKLFKLGTNLVNLTDFFHALWKLFKSEREDITFILDIPLSCEALSKVERASFLKFAVILETGLVRSI